MASGRKEDFKQWYEVYEGVLSFIFVIVAFVTILKKIHFILAVFSHGFIHQDETVAETSLAWPNHNIASFIRGLRHELAKLGLAVC